jgi:hypothetical protein
MSSGNRVLVAVLVVLVLVAAYFVVMGFLYPLSLVVVHNGAGSGGL